MSAEVGADRGQGFAPGATIGILGGGQLGRMTVLAAARLGYRCRIFCPEPDSPASHVAPAEVAAYDDLDALARFAEAVDLVTFEFENVPDRTASLLAGRRPTRPAPRVLHLCQERLREKGFLASIGVATTAWQAVESAAALPAAAQALGLPAILKSAQFGYDGKGQVRIEPGADLDAAWRRMGAGRGILEGFVDFEREISVIVARGPDGAMLAYPAVENRHRNHILDVTLVPAAIPPSLAAEAERIGRHIAERIGLVGLIAVEMFVTCDGRLLVNELAPRPHNSGHWSIDACVTSQFEQFVRAICGLPLGAVDPLGEAEMKNLIGDEVHGWRELLADPAAKLHLYGKAEARPGRKMGHVTWLKRR
jgi:5-(carboxyamino)imidazole ribonucleotide synthase